MAERRKHQRALLHTWVDLSSDNGWCRSRVTDVSMGGLGIEGLPPRGPSVTSEFPLPGIRLPVELAAEVVWTDGASGRSGLRFVDPDPGLAELLGSYVAGHLGD